VNGIMGLAVVAQDRGCQSVGRVESLVRQLLERSHPLCVGLLHLPPCGHGAGFRQGASLEFHAYKTQQPAQKIEFRARRLAHGTLLKPPEREWWALLSFS
jgi:hypothetical protein